MISRTKHTQIDSSFRHQDGRSRVDLELMLDETCEGIGLQSLLVCFFNTADKSILKNGLERFQGGNGGYGWPGEVEQPGAPIQQNHN